jgi:hypothetical protein
MKNWLFVLLMFPLAACSAAASSQPALQAQMSQMDQAPDLPRLGEAPELLGEVWLNSDLPLRLADLRGQVVLLDMWTFG